MQSSESASHGMDDPVWLVLTTKKHIVDKARLIPAKIKVSHPLNKSSNLSICIISADPQRAVKDVVDSPAFSRALAPKITRVIGYSKLKARYRTFESRRQLLSEHDVFLADDRIIQRLPETLGKIFYHGTIKRPIPVVMTPRKTPDGTNGNTNQKNIPKSIKEAAVAPPAIVSAEIERSLNAVPVSIRPGTNVAVRVGKAGFTPKQLSENISTVAESIIERFVVKQWRNVKGIHIKGPNTMAVPVWLAPDMWTDQDDVLDEGLDTPSNGKHAKESHMSGKGAKRKLDNGISTERVSKKKVHGGRGQVEEDRARAAARKKERHEQKARAFDLDDDDDDGIE